ncbi:MAG: hypothetical protein ACC726_06160 [Chloroflexota bacterium]
MRSRFRSSLAVSTLAVVLVGAGSTNSLAAEDAAPGGAALCDAVSAEDLQSLTGLDFGLRLVFTSCIYSSTSGEAFSVISLTAQGGSLDKERSTDSVEVSVGDIAGIANVTDDGVDILLDLQAEADPEDEGLLRITVAGSVAIAGMEPLDLGLAVADLAIRNLERLRACELDATWSEQPATSLAPPVVLGIDMQLAWEADDEAEWAELVESGLSFDPLLDALDVDYGQLSGYSASAFPRDTYFALRVAGADEASLARALLDLVTQDPEGFEIEEVEIGCKVVTMISDSGSADERMTILYVRGDTAYYLEMDETDLDPLLRAMP